MLAVEQARAVAVSPRSIRTRERVPEFDGLRAFAIALVLFGHLGQFSLRQPTPWTAFAKTGVLLFFVLSGFLITSLLCAEDRIFGRVDLRKFYGRRALRLLPAAWLMIGVVVILKLTQLVVDESWWGVLASLSYVRNIFGRGTSLAHLWSLSLEEQFYFVWPVLFVVLPRHRLQVAIGVTAASALSRAVGIAFQLQDVGSGVFYLRPWYRFDSIMAGSILALILARTPTVLSSPRRWFVWFAHPASGIALLCGFGLMEGVPSIMPWALSFQTLGCVALVASLLVHPESVMRRLLRLRPLAWLGRFSYSLYLWQQIFIVTKIPDWGLIRRPVVDVLASIVCALISWHFVEQPFLRIKSSWQRASTSTGPINTH